MHNILKNLLIQLHLSLLLLTEKTEHIGVQISYVHNITEKDFSLIN